VRLQGGTVTLSGSGSMFTVERGTLILENITLKGSSNNTRGLVYINSGGKLEMRAGSVITGNNTSDSTKLVSGGAGVRVSGGTFTMSGGKISGNTSSGVYVNGGSFGSGQGSTFTMSGGVYVGRGTFTMSGGEISGNTASFTSLISGPCGGGVYVGGTFTKTGGIIYGYTGDTASNAVIYSDVVLINRGHAVYISDSKRRESTAGPTVNLDSNVDGAAGAGRINK
jgi:hypothetical protein